MLVGIGGMSMSVTEMPDGVRAFRLTGKMGRFPQSADDTTLVMSWGDRVQCYGVLFGFWVSFGLCFPSVLNDCCCTIWRRRTEKHLSSHHPLFSSVCKQCSCLPFMLCLVYMETGV
jgi:hypothetical protein